MAIVLDLCYLLFAIVAAPWWARKARVGWRQRFGGTDPLPPKQAPRVLIHAVSVGEVNAIRALAPLLAREFEVVVAASTDTGLARAMELFEGKPPEGGGRTMRVVRFPLDFSFAVRRFLRAVEPDAAALVELEVWPNFLAACARRGVPAAVLNGRLSDRSFRGYRRARALIAPMFRRLAAVGAQDDVYAARFCALGVPPERVAVVGNMKWDSTDAGAGVESAEVLAREMGIDRSRALVVAGSTAPEEHELLHRATPPGAQLLCAPRRPEWFDDAAAALPGCVRRSARRAGEGADRFLLDTIGELRKAYALADVVVVGRSFGELYGSDPMEPAALGKAIVIGPAVADFRAAVETLEQAGGIVRAARTTLGQHLARLLADGGERARLSAAARSCVDASRGATARNAEIVRRLVLSPDERRSTRSVGRVPHGA